MTAIRINMHLDSEILNLPQLRPMLGRDVEIIVLDTPKAKETSSYSPLSEETRRERLATLLERSAPDDPTTEEARRTALHGTLIKYNDPFGPATPLEDWSAFSDDWNTYK